jgi:hypothetical protein
MVTVFCFVVFSPFKHEKTDPILPQNILPPLTPNPSPLSLGLSISNSLTNFSQNNQQKTSSISKGNIGAKTNSGEL